MAPDFLSTTHGLQPPDHKPQEGYPEPPLLSNSLGANHDNKDRLPVFPIEVAGLIWNFLKSLESLNDLT